MPVRMLALRHTISLFYTVSFYSFHSSCFPSVAHCVQFEKYCPPYLVSTRCASPSLCCYVVRYSLLTHVLSVERDAIHTTYLLQLSWCAFPFADYRCPIFFCGRYSGPLGRASPVPWDPGRQRRQWRTRWCWHWETQTSRLSFVQLPVPTEGSSWESHAHAHRRETLSVSQMSIQVLAARQSATSHEDTWELAQQADKLHHLRGHF